MNKKVKNIRSILIFSVFLLSIIFVQIKYSKSLHETFNEKNDNDSTSHIKVNIQDFGAHAINEPGYNDFDSSEFINKTIDAGKNVSIPGNIYKIKSAIILRNGVTLQGQRGISKIVIDDSFVKGKYCPDNEFAIYNEHFSGKYNENTLDSITIDGIDFDLTKVSQDSISTILGLANIKKANITNCRFFVKGLIGATNLDIYASSKNVTIRNCEFINTTNAPTGGCIWIRNLNLDTGNENSITDNILVDSCHFSKSSNDEALAVYTVKGSIRNVNITNNVFNFTGYRIDIPISVYSNSKNGYIEGVNFSNNTINADDFTSRVVMINDTKSAGYINNIEICNNIINVKASATETTKVVSTGSNAKNVTISNNKISNVGSISLYTGIEGGKIVDSNTVIGSFKENSINYADSVTNNKVNGSSIGNSSIINNNTIWNTKIGIKYTIAGRFKANENKIILIDDNDSMGIVLLNLGQNSALTSVTAKDNSIECNNKDTKYFFYAIGKMILKNNIIIRNGKQIDYINK